MWLLPKLVQIAWPLSSAILFFASPIYESCYPLPKEPHPNGLRHLVIASVSGFTSIYLASVSSRCRSHRYNIFLGPPCLFAQYVSLNGSTQFLSNAVIFAGHFKCIDHLPICECTCHKNKSETIDSVAVKY